MPKRIQRKRTRGWRMPQNAVYVGRPTKWGNPFRPSGDSDRGLAVCNFSMWIREGIAANQYPDLTELRGKDLACWCPLDQPCHADVLLELANPAVRLC